MFSTSIAGLTLKFSDNKRTSHYVLNIIIVKNQYLRKTRSVRQISMLKDCYRFELYEKNNRNFYNICLFRLI